MPCAAARGLDEDPGRASSCHLICTVALLCYSLILNGQHWTRVSRPRESLGSVDSHTARVLSLDMWVVAGGCSQVSARDCRLLGDSGEPPAEAPKPLTNPRALAHGPAPPRDAAVQRRHCPRVTSRTGMFMCRRRVEPARATAAALKW